MVPVLETARLRLRGLCEADLSAWAAAMGDEEVVRHVGGRTFDREETWRRMLCSPGLWATLGYGYWTVEPRDGGPMIGQVGFADFKRAMEPSLEGLPEMGWMFVRAAHGRGYCSEAVAAGLAWADENLNAPEIVAIIAPGNAASIRVAEKHGFARAEETLYKGDPTLIFRRRA